jgi:hypothetical protein
MIFGRLSNPQSDRFTKSSSAFQNQMHAKTRTACPVYFPEGLSRVCDIVPPDAFVVSVNGEESTLSLVEAVFLSPRIFSALKADTTIRFLEITDDQIEAKHIDDLLDLLRGGRGVTVTKSSRLSLLRLSRHLGNRDLAQLLFGLRDEETIIGPLAQASIGFDLTVHPRDELFLLDVDTLEQLLRSERLRIESEDWLLDLILELGSEYRRLLNEVKYEFLCSEGLSKFLDSFGYCEMTDDIWTSLARRLRGETPIEFPHRHVGPASDQRGFRSSIVFEFPSVLSVIEEKNAQLLYRGTRDGFSRSNCHPRVTGHSNLLILVETTGGWIFGGYAHCKWPANHVEWAGDPSQKSFLFTLKNPHNIPARRFGMASTRQAYVLQMYTSGSPIVWMGSSGAIALMTGCSASAVSHNRGFAGTDSTFVNDSGHDGKTLFTGSETYTVKAVEIFEFFD